MVLLDCLEQGFEMIDGDGEIDVLSIGRGLVAGLFKDDQFPGGGKIACLQVIEIDTTSHYLT